MKKKIFWLFLAISLVCGICGIVWISLDQTSQSEQTDSVKIAIAWRADTDNEFCTNVVAAFRAAGVEVVVLPQVKAPYIAYDGDRVDKGCLDSLGIGYLNNTYGAMVRDKGYEGSNVSEVLKGVHGVVFTGGEDISSSLYAVQQDWHHVESEIDFNAARDVSDYLTIAYCLDHDIPVLGLCRGAQMLGVVSGATMIQDIPTWFTAQNLPYHYEHRREKAEGEDYRDYVPHSVSVASGSLFSQFCSSSTLQGCPSWHHQALLSVEATALRVVGTTSVSGVDMIEAIERTDKRCAIGLQFHPEAAITKHLGCAVNNTNATQFMPYNDAMSIVKDFIDHCK